MGRQGVRVLTEERDKGKRREGSYLEERVEREVMIGVAQSARDVWGATYRNKEYILLNMERDK